MHVFDRWSVDLTSTASTRTISPDSDPTQLIMPRVLQSKQIEEFEGT